MNSFDFGTLVFVAGVTSLALLMYALGMAVGAVRGLKRGIVLGAVILADGINKKRDNDESR